jgi:hypothetical protein
MKPIFLPLIAILLIAIGASGCGSDGENLINSALEKTLTIQHSNLGEGGNGTVDPSFGSHSYKYQERVIVTATPQPGSVFVGWQGIDGVMSKMSAVDSSRPSSWQDYKISVRMDHDHTITALFSSVCNLTIEINGGGKVAIQKVEGLPNVDGMNFTGLLMQNPANLTYLKGAYIAFTVQPMNSYLWAGWTWNGEMWQIDPKRLPLNTSIPFTGALTVPLYPMSKDVTICIKGDVKLTANFVEVKLPLK